MKPEDFEMRETLDGALAAIFGEPTDGPPDGAPPDDGGIEVPDQIADLLAAAQAAFDAADQALRDGDLAAYQQRIDEAQNLLDRAVDLIVEQEQ